MTVPVSPSDLYPPIEPIPPSTNNHYGTLLSPPRCCIQNSIADSFPAFPLCRS